MHDLHRPSSIQNGLPFGASTRSAETVAAPYSTSGITSGVPGLSYQASVDFVATTLGGVLGSTRLGRAGRGIEPASASDAGFPERPLERAAQMSLASQAGGIAPLE